MVVIYYAIIIIIIHNKLSLAEMTLAHFATKYEPIFKEAPKMWQKYIHKFLHIHLKKIQPESDTYGLILNQLSRHSIEFLKLRDASLSPRIFFEYAVWTSRFFHVSVLESEVMDFRLLFRLSPLLRLNITFFFMVIQTFRTDCRRSRLLVIPGDYQYCGRFSQFNLYPYHFNVSLSLSIFERTFKQKLNGSYSVVDKDLIVTYAAVYNRYQNYTIAQHFLRVANRDFVTSFLMQTVKIYRIKLIIFKVQISEFVVFDGPLNIFKIIKSCQKMSFCVSSTFQCLLQFSSSKQANSNTFTFHAIQHADRIHMKVKADIKSVPLPNDNCSDKLCVILFESILGFQLNFTVVTLNVSPTDHESCLLQGLAIIDEFLDSCLPGNETCLEYGGYRNILSRSFHTKHQLLWVVLYWYKGYSTITTEIIISATTCKGVKIDVCSYESKCSRVLPTGVDTSLCIPYLSSITKFTNLKLTTLYDKLKTVLYFSLPEDQCVTLMLVKWIHSPLWDFFSTVSHNPHCSLILTTTGSGSEITKIDGAFDKISYMKIGGPKNVLLPNKEIAHNDISEFHVFTLRNMASSENSKIKEIKGVHVFFHKQRSRNDWSNIHLLGVARKEKLQKDYFVRNIQPYNQPSGVLLQLMNSNRKDEFGLDLMVDTGLSDFGPVEQKGTVCSIIHRTYFSFQVDQGRDSRIVHNSKLHFEQSIQFCFYQYF